MTMKGFISGILLFCILASLTACSNGSEPQVTDETTANNGNTSVETTVRKAPELPVVDMGEYEFNILTQGWWNHSTLEITDVGVAEQNGEVLNDAAYKRKSDVEDKYNCTINEMNVSSGSSEVVDQLNTSVMAGDDLYGLALIRASHYNALINSGTLTDLTKIPYLELENDYYLNQSYDTLSIDGSHYGIVSNLSTNQYLLIFCSYFNKVMLDEYKLGDMYDLVRDGKWTIDSMYEMSKLVAADLNNDGEFDSDDRYGTTYIIDVPEGLINSCGVRLAKDVGDGIEKTYRSETSLNRLQHIFDILCDKSVTFNIHSRVPSSDVQRLEISMFTDAQSLFSLAGGYYALQFRNMKDDFGIIPLPKYDEAQEDYLSPVFSNIFPVTVVPRSNLNSEWTGILLEELSYRGYTELLPALYDTILTGKCARDDDSVEMLDMIFSYTTYDIGMIFDFGGVRTEIRNIFSELDGNFVSTFASIDSKVDANIDELIRSVNETK